MSLRPSPGDDFVERRPRPLLTGNGKPYVLMRCDGGPLSLRHG
ncbi:MAG: hypothetical protein U0S48_06545 [Solirubrobacteraceae bacterium]